MQRGRQLIAEFAGDRKGAIAIIFAFSVFILCFVAGLAIDASRAYSVAAKISSALDAAALSAAKYMDSTGASDSEVESRALAVFNAHTRNLPVDGVSFRNFRAVPNRNANSVAVEVNADMPTAFAQLAGYDLFEISKVATAIFQSKKIEVAMVLDITGSMCEPASSPCTRGPKIDGLKDATRDLINALAASNNDPGAIRVGVVPYSAAVNAGSYSGVATGGVSTDGCTVERSGSAAYSDVAPGAGSHLGVSNVAANANYSCPPSPIIPMKDLSSSTSKNALLGAVDSMNATGWTAGHIGIAWGWFMVSQAWQSIWPAESKPANRGSTVVKAVVIMTDGMFNTSYYNGNVNSSDPLAPGSSGYQALQLCEAMRQQNITIYTVAFQAPFEAENLLRACAGSAPNFYNSDNTAQLRASFRDIAEKLTSLRLKS